MDSYHPRPLIHYAWLFITPLILSTWLYIFIFFFYITLKLCISNVIIRVRDLYSIFLFLWFDLKSSKTLRKCVSYNRHFSYWSFCIEKLLNSLFWSATFRFISQFKESWSIPFFLSTRNNIYMATQISSFFLSLKNYSLLNNCFQFLKNMYLAQLKMSKT